MAVIETRKWKNGTVTHRAKIRMRGFPPQSKSFDRITDAKRWAQQVEAGLQNGSVVPGKKSERYTVEELIERYVRTRLTQKSKSTQEAQLRQFNWWKRQIGSCFLENITSAVIIECREKLGRENVPGGNRRSSATCNRYMAALAHAFTVAWKEWEWMEQNPLRRISKLREPEGRIRFLDDKEQTRLLDACKNSKSPFLFLIVLVGIATGMRLNEIVSLSWPQIDLRKGVIVINITKNKRPRQVPLQGPALIEFARHSKVRRIDSDLVFPSSHDPSVPVSIRTAWESARERANLANFRFHDLRHTSASYFAMSGASARDLCEIFGWKTLQMAMRYAHLSECHTVQIAATMNERFVQKQKGNL